MERWFSSRPQTGHDAVGFILTLANHKSHVAHVDQHSDAVWVLKVDVRTTVRVHTTHGKELPGNHLRFPAFHVLGGTRYIQE